MIGVDIALAYAQIKQQYNSKNSENSKNLKNSTPSVSKNPKPNHSSQSKRSPTALELYITRK
jgi:hypothetical protein